MSPPSRRSRPMRRGRRRGRRRPLPAGPVPARARRAGGRPARAQHRARRPPASRPTPAAPGSPSTTATVAGVALALVRDGVWGLSLFAVADDLQRRGVGRRAARRGPRASRRTPAGGSSSPPSTPARCAATRAPAWRCIPASRRPASPTASGSPTWRPASRTPAMTGSPVADAIGRARAGAPATAATCRSLLAHRCRLLTFEDRAFARARRSRA